MRLYLLRHGTADPFDQCDSDAERALVAKGVDQCTKVAQLLMRMKIRPRVILSSPYRRALQSAQVVASTMDWQEEITLEPSLEPAARVERACSALLSPTLLASDALLAVGHEPLLSSITGRLLGHRGLPLDLRKGGLVELRILPEAEPSGVLVGLVRPAHLRLLTP